jgi:hypothetical protein
LLAFLLVLAIAPLSAEIQIRLPNKDGSLRMAVIGDTGTGSRSQYEIGSRLVETRQAFPFEIVLMLGDNLYGGERPQDFLNKFEKPYNRS